MVVTMEQVLDALAPIEPSYKRAIKFGAEALPHLEKIIKTSSPSLASKAVYMASLIQDEQAVSILKAAAHSKSSQIRVAAATASRNVSSSKITEVLELLESDSDSGVRKRCKESQELTEKRKEMRAHSSKDTDKSRTDRRDTE